PFTRPGYRWLGDICPKDMTARADKLRQLENCRAGAATNIEYALARLGRRQIQKLLRESRDRTIHSRVLVGPRPRRGAIPEFDLRRVSLSRLDGLPPWSLGLSRSIKPCFGVVAQGNSEDTPR